MLLINPIIVTRIGFTFDSSSHLLLIQWTPWDERPGPRQKLSLLLTLANSTVPGKGGALQWGPGSVLRSTQQMTKNSCDILAIAPCFSLLFGRQFGQSFPGRAFSLQEKGSVDLANRPRPWTLPVTYTVCPPRAGDHHGPLISNSTSGFS